MYTRVPTSDDGDEEFIQTTTLSRWRRTWIRLSFPLWVVSMGLWLTLLPLATQLQTRSPTDESCTQKLSVWSPALPQVEVKDRKFMNTFMEPSEYRGKPNSQLEAAWDALWNIGVIRIPDENLPLLNKSVLTDWHRDGNGHVYANLEVFHDLHCLSFIRQYTYRDEYDFSDTPSFQGSPRMVREHVDHCIESLRLKLMCTSDVTPFLHIRDSSPLGFQPDFNVQHRCRDFDKIRDWYADAVRREIVVQ